jgi:hypothetical protein
MMLSASSTGLVNNASWPPGVSTNRCACQHLPQRRRIYLEHGLAVLEDKGTPESAHSIGDRLDGLANIAASVAVSGQDGWSDFVDP